MADQPRAIPRKVLIKLAIAGMLLFAAIIAVLCGLDWRSAVDAAVRFVRSAGPLAFFSGLAVLPAVGAPASAFTLVAGSAFGPQMGMGGVVAATLAAMAVDLALTYWLARRGVRPLLAWLVARLGYKLPEVESGDAVDLIVMLRMTPGIPFCVQNYLLGLADAPVGKYLVVSAIICLPQAAVFTMFGEALLAGRGGKVMLYLSALIALGAATHLVRRHWMRRRRNPAPAPGPAADARR